jgi:predicted nucleic acid-binding protein
MTATSSSKRSLTSLAPRLAACRRQDGEVVLFVSPFVLAEVREIHLKAPPKYGITAEQTDELARAVALLATIVTDVPEVYRHPYDPDDSAYVNLALKMGARLIVSRDRAS